jgi:hypothetical protein
MGAGVQSHVEGHLLVERFGVQYVSGQCVKVLGMRLYRVQALA